MSNWLVDKIKNSLSSSSEKSRNSVPEGVWDKCLRCDAVLYRPELERNASVCLRCNYHMRINARTRLNYFLDEQGRNELNGEIEPVDLLKFKDSKKYKDRLSQAQKNTDENDALITMRGEVEGLPLVAVAFEFKFMGGSMGTVVGEKFVLAAEYCIEHRLPLVCFAASGGARMQEALFSLMQMARTSAVLEKMKQASVPYISVLTDPVYGGVSASLAMLGDINIAEPNALIGFAGPRVIEQTVRQKLPEGFQRSEFLLEHGAVDMVVERQSLRPVISRLLTNMTLFRQEKNVSSVSSQEPEEGSCEETSTQSGAKSTESSL